MLLHMRPTHPAEFETPVIVVVVVYISSISCWSNCRRFRCCCINGIRVNLVLWEVTSEAISLMTGAVHSRPMILMELNRTSSSKTFRKTQPTGHENYARNLADTDQIWNAEFIIQFDEWLVDCPAEFPVLNQRQRHFERVRQHSWTVVLHRVHNKQMSHFFKRMPLKAQHQPSPLQ